MRDYEKIIIIILLTIIFIKIIVILALAPLIQHSLSLLKEFVPKKKEYVLLIRGTPNFKLQSLSNKTVVLSDFRGRVVVIIFWHTLSTSFSEQLKCLKELEDKWSDKVVFLYVNLGEKSSIVATFAKKHGLDMDRVLLGEDKFQSDPLIVKMTSTIIVDEQGKVLKADISVDCEDINRVLTEHYKR